jgi:hypothetical protein
MANRGNTQNQRAVAITQVWWKDEIYLQKYLCIDELRDIPLINKFDIRS